MSKFDGWPLACSSYSFSNPDLTSVLKKIKKMGFLLVDLGWPQMDIRNLDLDQVRRTIDKVGIRPCVLSIDLVNLTSNDDKRWYHGLLFLRRSLQVASQLHIKKVGLVARSSAHSSSPRRALLRVIKALRNVLPDCKDLEIPICVEIHPESPITDLSDAIIIKERVASPWIGYTLDTSLLTWLSISLEEAVHTLRDCPLNVHLREVTDHDFFGIPGRGNIDFKRFFQTLREINYNDSYIIELFKTKENFGLDLEEGICEAKRYLEEALKEIG